MLHWLSAKGVLRSIDGVLYRCSAPSPSFSCQSPSISCTCRADQWLGASILCHPVSQRAHHLGSPVVSCSNRVFYRRRGSSCCFFRRAILWVKLTYFSLPLLSLLMWRPPLHVHLVGPCTRTLHFTSADALMHYFPRRLLRSGVPS